MARNLLVLSVSAGNGQVHAAAAAVERLFAT